MDNSGTSLKRKAVSLMRRTNGLKIVYFSGTKYNSNATKIILVGLKIIFVQLKLILMPLKLINFSPTKIIISATEIIFSPTNIFSGTKIILVQTFKPYGPP